MPRYEVIYRCKRGDELRRVAFEAASPCRAFNFAEREARARWAELYEDGKPLCALELVAGKNAWLVSPLVGRATPAPTELDSYVRSGQPQRSPPPSSS